MSFPPNLGITNSFIIDSSCSIIFQEFPSLLPQLDQICSPFSKPRMNGYSRIKKSNTNRSKSVDFADLSLSRTSPYLSKFNPQTTPDLRKISTPRDSIPEHEDEHEHEHDHDVGEVFGAILGVSDGSAKAKKEICTTSPFLIKNDDVVKRSFSVKRSASVTDRYSRIHHQSGEGSEQCGNEFGSHEKSVKKKGKFFRAFKRLFGL